MNYKETAQELFEILLAIFAGCNHGKAFEWFCEKYPELLEEYDRKMNDMAKTGDPAVPELTEEQIEENIRTIIAIAKKDDAR